MPCSGPRGPFAAALRVERVGDRARVGIDLDDGVEGGPGTIEALDAIEVEIDELPGRVSPGLHPRLELRQCRFVERELCRRLRLRRGARLAEAQSEKQQKGTGSAPHGVHSVAWRQQSLAAPDRRRSRAGRTESTIGLRNCC